MPLSITRATKHDAKDVFGLLYPDHFDSCGFSNRKFSIENAAKVLDSWLDNYAWVAKVDGQTVGFASMCVAHTFFEDPEAMVEIFYVSPRHRKYGISREFVKRLVADADNHGAGNIDATCMSGIEGSNDNLWANLWGKFGFKKLGTIMMRSK